MIAKTDVMYQRRPNYLRNVFETVNFYGSTGGSTERRGLKESTGVLGAPIGTEDPPFTGERNFRSRDDVVDDRLFGEGETDPKNNEPTNEILLTGWKPQNVLLSWGLVPRILLILECALNSGVTGRRV